MKEDLKHIIDIIRNKITLEQMESLLQYLGGEPKIINDNLIISKTICHNPPEVKCSRKLYYYNDNKLFKCYTECDLTFDIFNLISKINHWDNNTKIYSSIDFVVSFFGFDDEEFNINLLRFEEKKEVNKDALIFNRYDENKKIEVRNNKKIVLKQYDKTILERLDSYPIQSWLNEGISKESMKRNKIGFYQSTNRITIPHYDIDNRFIGLRGRTLVKDDEQFGKYIPLTINNILYSHPLHFNLYNINNSKDNIKLIKKAIIFEGEKSTLKYQSIFGVKNDISTACCGFSVSEYQINLLISLGVNEIIIGFDKQFKEIGDKEFIKLKKNLINISNKFSKLVNVSFLFDKYDLLDYKSSPIDEGKEKFIKLFENRIIL